MKRILALLLMALLLAGTVPACALTSEEALDKVSSYLTEVYSYTAEEAEKFEAHAELKQDGWLITYWHADHPGWIYTAVYDSEEGRVTNAVSPFYMMEQFENYPGEGSVREGLNRAHQYGWFSIWEDHMREELQQYMADWGIKATAKLNEGLSNGTITAGNALHEYFVSCYGDEIYWTPELKQWHDAELEAFGLVLDAEEEIEIHEGIVTYEGLMPNGQKTTATRFIGEVPQQLAQAFSHPQLTGWNCLCGATMQNVSNQYGHGLAAFEKDGQRLLIAMRHNVDEEGWLISPVSKRALYTDRDMYILPDASEQRDFTIVYQNGETETERFEVTVSNMNDGRLDVHINHYLRMDEQSGSGIAIAFGKNRAVAYEGHRQIGEEVRFQAIRYMMSMVDITAFPTTIEALQTAEEELIPEGYALCRGVHLRQKTSSRSKDLGEYNSGVLVKILGTEPGNPDPWYHVQVGTAEGYMSSAYVDPAVTQDTAYALSHPLPVAQTVKKVNLKKGMSLLSGTIQELPEGTMMQVLAQCDGGWLHVSIPQNGMNWEMDLNGIDGYVKEKDVRTGGTPLVMEWAE